MVDHDGEDRECGAARCYRADLWRGLGAAGTREQLRDRADRWDLRGFGAS
jgi:hypothetical protein